MATGIPLCSTRRPRSPLHSASSARSAIGFLAQGTLYPDVIESASRSQEQAARTIKTHHNVGGLPEDMSFELIEPLRLLFKDEVRAVGKALGLPDEIVWRHPFPGPGLAIRVLGEVTWERLETLRKADAILLDELHAAELYRQTAQVFAVLLPVKSVGVMGDNRTYADVIALRAVTTDDFMTADWARLPYDLLARISNRIVNEVAGVNQSRVRHHAKAAGNDRVGMSCRWQVAGQKCPCNLQPAVCHLQPATCNLPPATCHLQLATCHLPPATCHLPPCVSYCFYC